MSNEDWAQCKLSDRASYVEKFGNVNFWYIFILLFYIRSTFLHELPHNLSRLQFLLSNWYCRKLLFFHHPFRINSFDMLVTFIFFEKFLWLKGRSFSSWRLICSKKRMKVKHRNVYIIKIINLNIFGHLINYLICQQLSHLFGYLKAFWRKLKVLIIISHLVKTEKKDLFSSWLNVLLVLI